MPSSCIVTFYPASNHLPMYLLVFCEEDKHVEADAFTGGASLWPCTLTLADSFAYLLKLEPMRASAQHKGRCPANTPLPAYGPDLIGGGFFWIRCFLLFFIFLLILSVTVGHENIRSPVDALLT